MSYRGPLANRPDDIASLGCYWGKPGSGNQPPTTRSQALEAFYQYTINAALNVVFDAQYVFRLNGHPSPGTAILGAQFDVTF